jgi:DNA-binding transcriptional ArsR family regulator
MDNWRELKLIMKALGDVARLTIVYHLARQGEVTVTELTEMLAISQPLVSWHLRKLRKAGLIHTRRVGRQVYCSLNARQIQHGIRGLEGLIDPTFLLEMPPFGDALMEAEVEAID